MSHKLDLLVNPFLFLLSVCVSLSLLLTPSLLHFTSKQVSILICAGANNMEAGLPIRKLKFFSKFKIKVFFLIIIVIKLFCGSL